MKKTIILLLLISANMMYAQEKTTTAEKIIALEKAALERWNNGDPDGYLELYANDISYFDPLLEKRSDGLEALTKLYEPVKGQVKVDRYEMIGTQVQTSAEMAVLTYNLVSFAGNKTHRWNCTEVFRMETDGNWKIIHSHWSLTKPELR